MKYISVRKLVTLTHMAMVFAGLVIIGWLMNGFNAPTFVSVGTVAVCCYLIWVGSGGIALSSIWVVALMSVAALNQLWLQDLPRPEFIYTPMLLMASWLLALMIVWRLGKISDLFRQARLPRSVSYMSLLSLTLLCLALGWLSYPETRSYLLTALR